MRKIGSADACLSGKARRFAKRDSVLSLLIKKPDSIRGKRLLEGKKAKSHGKVLNTLFSPCPCLKASRKNEVFLQCVTEAK